PLPSQATTWQSPGIWAAGERGVFTGVNTVAHLFAMHAGCLQSSVRPGQSASALHATQAPLPSPTLPPDVAHPAPFATGGAEGVHMVQVGVTQSFAGIRVGTSLSSLTSVSTPPTH